MPSLLLLPLCLCLLALPARAQEEDWGDSHTIRITDLPSNPPHFEQYPAKPIYKGQPAAPDVKSHPRSRLFRTRIRQDSARGPNFAGHYTIASWGCGSGCMSLAIVDAISGQVFHPPNLESVDNQNLDYDELAKPDGELVKYRLDSRLLIVIGGINEDPARRGISYFVWKNGRLERIRFVPKP